MDVFYYWKDHAKDIKDVQIGRFRSAKERLSELQAGYPDYIWAFKTPKGRKGKLQLLARLVWADKPLVPFTPAMGDNHIYYDPEHPKSVWFSGSDGDAGIAAISQWAKRHFPAAVASNFQGVNGQHALRGGAITELASLSKNFDAVQFQLALPREA